MTELFAIATAMIGFLKTIDASQAVILTVIICALLVLLFNVIAIWKLTSPVREIAVTLKHFTLRMDEGENRFRRIEDEQQDQNLAIKEIKAHLGRLSTTQLPKESGGRNI